MDIYITSKNTGPTWTGPDPLTMLYIGNDLEKAIEAVGDFVKYEREPGNSSKAYYYTVAPDNANPELVKYYMVDGWWRSIVKIKVGE